MRILCLVAFVTMSMSLAAQGTLKKETIKIGDLQREYFVYLPAGYSPSKKIPLVLAFHGHGGTAKGTIAQYNFDPVADEEGFIVVYPNGIDKGWNDGRDSPKKPATTDDVRFVSELLDTLAHEYAVDERRIFSTGLSNGAIFSIYLAYKLPERILAIAPVCGSMPENLETVFNPVQPVSMLLINGTKDPLIPYEGGPVLSEKAERGAVIGTEKLIQRWISFNNCSGTPRFEKIPDLESEDDCSATITTYTNCVNSSEVAFIKVEGGGHTWPGGKQYLPKAIIGKVCRDFNAEDLIWSFFKRQKPRP
jgi:polyhydroxybutyrate depolymerase